MPQPVKYHDFAKGPIFGALAHQGDDGQTDQETGKSFGRHVGEFVAQDVVGENFVPPPARWWDEGRKGRRAEATGTGKGYSDVPLWLADFANNAQYVPQKNLPAAMRAGGRYGLEVTAANSGKLGGAVGKLMAPNWIGNSLAGKSGLARGAANVGTAVGVGLAVGVGGEVAASVLDDTSEEENDLRAARFYGDKDLEAKIMDRVNSKKTSATNVRTLSHGVSTGSMVGPQGAMVGGGAAAGVVLARTAMGGEKHMMAGMTQKETDNWDKKQADFIRTSRSAPMVASMTPEDVNIFLTDRIERVARGEKHPDTLKPYEEFLDIERLKKDIPEAFADKYGKGHREKIAQKYAEKPVSNRRWDVANAMSK